MLAFSSGEGSERKSILTPFIEVDLTPESELGLDNFFVILRVWFSGEGGRRLRLGGRRLFVPRRSQPVQIKVDDRRGV